MQPDPAAFEQHYGVGKLATMWGVGRETIRLLVKDEPGVIKICLGRKQARTTYAIPASVVARIHTKLLNLSRPAR